MKKNKYGMKQERIIGIDGKMVYNTRRDKFRGNSTAVYRAQRDLASVMKVQTVDTEKKTFQITWKEDSGELYNIEYICENTKDCNDITAKLNYLITKRRSGVSNG